MISVFSNEKSDLAEGVLWHSTLEIIFWVDINKKTVYGKEINSKSEGYDYSWILDETPSALVLINAENCILVVTDKRLVKLNVLDGVLTTLVNLNLPKGYRTNDAGVGPNNTLWFGTMECKPTGLNGAVYCVDACGKIQTIDIKIGIPNTFLWDENTKRFYISDSFQQKMFYLNKVGYCWHVNEFIDLSNEIATPDGGCIANNGNIYNAQWDGYCIAVYDNAATTIEKILLPAIKPTNCTLGGSDYNSLFITTATEGMTKDEFNKYPCSGYLLKIDLPSKISNVTQLIWEPKC